LVVPIEALENWVILEPCREKRLHFVEHYFVKRPITDPLLKRAKMVVSLVFLVDEEDGRPVEKSFSVLSMKLAQELTPYLEGKRYVHYDFVIHKPVERFAAPRLVTVIPRPPKV